ncbi:MAG: pyridoxamine 5'-phosphate oxidase family protein [Spirochaetales bacterium]|nr:pyridoxamine 5'-phosphate oxidase family protein [Spirochaetales bacterium]
MELNFDELKREIELMLEKTKTMVLATSENNKVTARSICIINDGLDIYFQTDKNFEKCQQIKANRKVALCIDNFQLEGTAFEIGSPLEPYNSYFQKNFQEKHNGSFKTYSHLKNETAFKVEPTKITLWKYIDEKPCRDILYNRSESDVRTFYNMI